MQRAVFGLQTRDMLSRSGCSNFRLYSVSGEPPPGQIEGWAEHEDGDIRYSPDAKAEDFF